MISSNIECSEQSNSSQIKPFSISSTIGNHIMMENLKVRVIKVAGDETVRCSNSCHVVRGQLQAAKKCQVVQDRVKTHERVAIVKNRRKRSVKESNRTNIKQGKHKTSQEIRYKYTTTQGGIKSGVRQNKRY